TWTATAPPVRRSRTRPRRTGGSTNRRPGAIACSVFTRWTRSVAGGEGRRSTTCAVTSKARPSRSPRPPRRSFELEQEDVLAVRAARRRPRIEPESLSPVRREQDPAAVGRDIRTRHRPEERARGIAVVRDVAAMVREPPHAGADAGSHSCFDRDDFVVPRPPFDGVVAAAEDPADERHELSALSVVPARVMPRRRIVPIEHDDVMVQVLRLAAEEGEDPLVRLSTRRHAPDIP